MKLLVTTATAALLSAGIAFAEGDVDVSAAADTQVTADTDILTTEDGGTVAESEITQDGGLTVETGAEAGAASDWADNDTTRAHAMTDLDTDVSGDISLTEAQDYDPSVTEEAFGEFDANGDGMLDADEYAMWEAGMDSSMRGQGDAGLDAEPNNDAIVTPDSETGADFGAETEADVGLDLDAPAIDGDLNGDANADAELEAQ